MAAGARHSIAFEVESMGFYLQAFERSIMKMIGRINVNISRNNKQGNTESIQIKHISIPAFNVQPVRPPVRPLVRHRHAASSLFQHRAWKQFSQ